MYGIFDQNNLRALRDKVVWQLNEYKIRNTSLTSRYNEEYP